MDVGRPTVMTPEVLSKLEYAFAMDCTDEEACSYADISTTSLYKYQNEHPEFAERKQALKQKPFLKARETVVKSLDKPDMALKYLERKKKKEFSQSIDLELKGEIVSKVVSIDE